VQINEARDGGDPYWRAPGRCSSHQKFRLIGTYTKSRVMAEEDIRALYTYESERSEEKNIIMS